MQESRVQAQDRRLAPGPARFGLCPGPAQCSGPWKQGPAVTGVGLCPPEQLGRGEGGPELLQGYLGLLLPGLLCHVRAGLGAPGHPKLLTAQITVLASRPSNLFPAQGTSSGLLSPSGGPPPAVARPTTLSPTPGREAFLLRPQGVSADCCLVPTTRLLTDTHFTSP